MVAATRIMAAGKAGLECLPYFVDELLAQGIPQLAPWAADHMQEQINTLNVMVQERRSGPWQKIYQIGSPNTRIGIVLTPDEVQSKRLLGRVNPLSAETTALADHPALLAAWCRINIGQYCRETLALWESYKWENGLGNDQQLAVVIPFCPEGPTSGTVGMYLGAALRKYFADRRRGNELVVWGIELCPPVNEDATGNLDQFAARNIFRGFVAREELLRNQGLPLTDNPQDTGSHQPFDITIAFDGGATKAPFDDINDIHQAMDRAAAQTTACLLNGAAGGDPEESANWLREGGRWNALLTHVVSEGSYNRACRYLNYHVRLPWYREPEKWKAASTTSRKQTFNTCVKEEIRPLLENEKDSTVLEKVKLLAKFSDDAQSVKWDQGIAKPFTGNHKKVEAILGEALTKSEEAYQEFNLSSPNALVARKDPFCINMMLPEGLRRSLSEQMRDSNDPIPLGNFLGDNAISAVRNQITGLITQVLQRSDCLAPESNSQALFEQIIAIPIGDLSNDPSNRNFRPYLGSLLDFVRIEKRGHDGDLNFLPYSLRERAHVAEPENNDPWERIWSLKWNLKDVSFDIPVEFSFLTLARCRPEDGFRDVSTYDRLEQAHRERTGDLRSWQEYARYYGVRPPTALLTTDSSDNEEPGQIDADKDGHNTVSPIPEADILESKFNADPS